MRKSTSVTPEAQRSFMQLEPLESRQLLTAVAWTGSGGDHLWHNPLNWSGNAVPTIADDVTIDLPASDPTIFLTVDSGSQSVNSLTSNELLRLIGGSLTVATTVNFSKNISLESSVLIGGTYTGTGGAFLTPTPGGGELQDVTLNGQLLLATDTARVKLSGSTTFTIARLSGSNSNLRLAPGYVLVNPVTAEGAATGPRFITVGADGPGTSTISAAGSIRHLVGTSANLTIQQEQPGTLINNGLISEETNGRSLIISADVLTNNSVIQTLGGTIQLGVGTTTSFTNSATGSITASGTLASILILGNNWVNAGTLSIGSSPLTLGGSFRTVDFNFGGFSRSGGTVTLAGQLDNVGSTLALDAASGSWVLSGGKITGGTVTGAGGASLLYGSTQGELADVSLPGDLALSSGSSVLVSGTTTFTRVLMPAGSTFGMLVGYTLNVEVLATGTGTAQRVVMSVARATPGDVTISPTGSIHVGAGATGSDFGIGGTAGTRLINQGEILVATGSLGLGGVFQNVGTLALSSGTSLGIGGTLDATAGLGSWSSGSSTVTLQGTLDITGTSLTLDNSTNSWQLRGGTIKGGTLLFNNGKQLTYTNSGGTFDTATLLVDVVLTDSTQVSFAGINSIPAVRLTAASATLNLLNGAVLTSLVSAEGAATGTRVVTVNGSASVASAGIIRLTSGSGGGLTISPFGTSAYLDNAGLIESLSTSQTLAINLGYFNTGVSLNNLGTISIGAGTTNMAASLANGAGGTVSIGSGATLNIDARFDTTGGAGTIVNSGGTLAIRNDLLNTGNTLLLDNTTGSLTLKGGRILGGSIGTSGTAKLVFNSQLSRMIDVTFLNDLYLDTTSAQVSVEGSTTFPVLHMSAGSTAVNLENGVVLTGTIRAEGAASGTRTIRVGVSAPSAVSVAGSGQIVLASGSGGDLTISFSTPGSLINNGLISAEATGRTLLVQPQTFTNNGTARAIAGTLSIASANWTNGPTGIVSETDATLTLAGNWSSTGSVSLTRGTGNIGGTGNLAGLTVTGAANVNIQGSLANTGNTFPWDLSLGTLMMAGGTITGGSIVLSGGATLQSNNANSRLVNVDLQGEIVLDTSNSVLSVSGTTRFTIARLRAGGATLNAQASYLLQDPVVAEGAASGTRKLLFLSNLTIASSATVRLLAGSGGDLSIERANSDLPTVTNYGLVSAEAAGRTLAFTADLLENYGTVQATAGTLSFYALNNHAGAMITASNAQLATQQTWSNAGLIAVTNTTVTLGGGTDATTFASGRFTRSGGSVTLTGGIVGGGILELTPTTGSFTLQGGSLRDLTLRRSGGADLVFTSSGGQLVNVVVEGDVILGTASAKVSIGGTTTFQSVRLSGSGATVLLTNNYTLNGSIIAEGAATGDRIITLSAPGTLFTIGVTGLIRIAPGTGAGLQITDTTNGTLVNNGTMSVAATGRTMMIAPFIFTNNGLVEADGGTISPRPSQMVTNFSPAQTLTGGTWRAIHGGTVSYFFNDIRTLNANVELGGPTVTWAIFSKLQTIGATGSLTLRDGISPTFTPVTGVLTNNGLIVIGPGSKLNLTGSYVQAATATLRIQVAGTTPATYGILATTGSATLAGTLAVVEANGYQLQRFDIQNVITSGGLTTGSFSTVTLPPPSVPTWKTVVVYLDHGIQLLTTTVADLNNDGELDLQDFFDFFNAFDATWSIADIDGDGEVGLGDFFLFFNLFDQGG